MVITTEPIEELTEEQLEVEDKAEALELLDEEFPINEEDDITSLLNIEL